MHLTQRLQHSAQKAAVTLGAMSPGEALQNWFTADVLGLLVATPLLLGWTEKTLRDEMLADRLTDVLLLSTLCGVVGAFVFAEPSAQFIFILYPLLLVMTFRSGLLGATAGIVTIAVVANWAYLQGPGAVPLSNEFGITLSRLHFLQLYVLVAVISTLPIATILKQRAALTNQLDMALNNMARGLSMFDADARLIICNELYRTLYGLPKALTVPGTPFSAIIQYYLSGDTKSESAEALAHVHRWIEHHTVKLAHGETVSRTRLKNGRTVLVVSRPLPGGGWVDIQEDITEKEHFDARITHMAHHDALTDLPNRVFLKEHLEQALAGIGHGERLAFHLIDLDDFKAVNDRFGHQAGDELLKILGRRLRLIVRETNIVARMGGDEFAVVQVGLTSEGAAISLAQRVIRAISKPYYIAGQRIVIGASVGIALAPNDANTAEQLTREADLALYQTKDMGGATYCLFTASLHQRMHVRHTLRARLDDALASGEIKLCYQPIFNLKESRITSGEALMRWHHPERGLILPNEFIPAAEESGHIGQLGEWAIREACAEAMKWPDHIGVAVNLSPVQFRQPGLARMIEHALGTAGLPASRLSVEVTESVFLDHSELNLETMRQLRDLGIGIALDDFGKDYSSLQYLQSFPFNKIKIDRSFIDHITRNDDTLKIVRAVVALARSLDITTTAEGVETAEQLESVRFEGCDEAQGYFISRPLPAADIERLYLSGSDVGQRLGGTQDPQENQSKQRARRARSFRSSPRPGE